MTRIWLSLLLVVLSWVGFTVGVMLSLFVLALCAPEALMALFSSMIMVAVIGAVFGSSSTLPNFYGYLGPLILLVSSVVRCKSPARHAVVQTIACVGFGVFSVSLLMPCIGEAAILFAAIALIEAKKNLSLRKLSAVIVAMFVVLYALVATISWIEGRFHKAPSTSTTQGQ